MGLFMSAGGGFLSLAQQAGAIIECVIIILRQNLSGQDLTTGVANNASGAFLGAVGLNNLLVSLLMLANRLSGTTHQANAVIESVVVVLGQNFGRKNLLTSITDDAGSTFLRAVSLEDVNMGLFVSTVRISFTANGALTIYVVVITNLSFTVLFVTTLRALLPCIANFLTSARNFLGDFILMVATNGRDFTILLVATLGALLPDITRLSAGGIVLLHGLKLVIAANGRGLTVFLIATLRAFIPSITALSAGGRNFLLDNVVVFTRQFFATHSALTCLKVVILHRDITL
jgi:hypothetical protein